MVGESGRGSAQRLKNKRSSHEGEIDGASIGDGRVGRRMQSVSNDILDDTSCRFRNGPWIACCHRRVFCERKC